MVKEILGRMFYQLVGIGNSWKSCWQSSAWFRQFIVGISIILIGFILEFVLGIEFGLLGILFSIFIIIFGVLIIILNPTSDNLTNQGE